MTSQAGLPALSATEFAQFRALILRTSGISLKDTKRELVAGRLARRLRHHGLSTYSEYLRLIARGTEPGELTELVNCITTNKTSFFREPHHFERLRDVLVPAWIERAKRGGSRRIRIWSAGCSTGEEPYSIAMVLHTALPASAGWDVRIVATDIDTHVLDHAAAGRYPLHQLEDLPPEGRACCVRGPGDFAIRDEVRARIDVRRLNLIAPTWPITGPFDAIFCRNVVIYFDTDTQRALFDRFADALAGDGRLFVGHSENLSGITDRFALDGQTVYRLVGERRALGTGSMTPLARPAPAEAEAEAVITPIAVGDVQASLQPAHYRTVLGSCVSVCLHDPVARIGGINHFALPAPEAGAEPSARYASVAMPQLIARLVELGADARRLVAKVFGASLVRPEMAEVAEHIARAVRALLTAAGIPIVAERLGGPHPLELHFLSDRGAALFREHPIRPAKR